MQSLEFETEFYPVYGSVIIIPKESVFYRGYPLDYPSVSDHPSFYGSINTANEYAKQPNRRLGTFTNREDLKLLDFRFMRLLLKELFEQIEKNSNLSKEDILCISSTILSFGLCSLEHQIRLLNNFPKQYIDYCPGFQKVIDSYKGPRLIEQPGVRIAETRNDSKTMGFLKGLFEGKFDGFISPRLKTPFHIEKYGELPPEMVILNPKESKIKQIPTIDPRTLPSLWITSLITANRRHVSLYYSDLHTDVLLRGGNIPNKKRKKQKIPPTHVLDDIQSNIYKKTPIILTNYTNGYENGRRWKQNYIGILHTSLPHPDAKGINLDIPQEGALGL